MRSRCVAAVCALVLVALALAVPQPASAAVGDALRTITPAASTTVDNTLVDPRCDSQGGTSVALVQGSKLAGVDHAAHPLLLAVSCIDHGGSAAATDRRSRINFLDPSDPLAPGSTSGKVIKSIQTRIGGVVAAPGSGWPHLIYRAERNDLLACGTDGTIHAIDISRFTTTADGTATAVPRPASLRGNCAALGWDAQAQMIYQGIVDNSGLIGIVRFTAVTPPATATVDATFTTPCAPSAVAVTGGVLVVACEGKSTVLRLDKNTGAVLPVNGTLGVLGLAPGANLDPDLGDLACDPVTFQRNPETGKDRFRDAFWSRNGPNGNGLVALEFPAFTCGLPANATTFRPGLGAPAAGVPDGMPKAACFDGAGNVVDADDDGIPDCWETGGIDFDGDGTVDLQLCVPVDTNGDGVVDATGCARPTRKDLFVEVDWMQFHKPDPRALSQAQSVATGGVTSVGAAFAAAPVANPDATTGISIHFLVDEQVTFQTLAGGTATHVDELVFTPCTPPGISLTGTQNAKSLGDAADFDTIKSANFGTAAERAHPNAANVLNAKRLVFRWMLVGHKLVGLNQGGASGSGCAEIGGDDGAVTLGAFTLTTVDGVSHNRGTLEQFTGTFMHELGHTLGFRHGGHEDINCKPNYLSIMSYSRQFPGSPIPGRRLDYSRAPHPVLSTPSASGVLDEASLLETAGVGFDASLGPIAGIFPSADQTAFGPGAFSVATANQAINWNRSKQGPNPTIQSTPLTTPIDLNAGPGGCDGVGVSLEGHDDWANVLYRFTAALDFGAGVHSTPNQEVTSITQEQEEELFLTGDVDHNGIGDGVDCGGFTCLHRIDVKPSFPVPKTIKLGAEATVTVAIFSETAVNGSLVWNAEAQIVKNVIPELGPTPSLTLSVGGVVVPVKTNFNGEGTCSMRDVADPNTGTKDGRKDALCQFTTSGLPLGTNWAVVSGFFTHVNSANETELRGFRSRQLITIVP